MGVEDVSRAYTLFLDVQRSVQYLQVRLAGGPLAAAFWPTAAVAQPRRVLCDAVLSECLVVCPTVQEYAQEYMYNELEGPQEEEGEGADMQQ